jgi:hypothetical protein
MSGTFIRDIADLLLPELFGLSKVVVRHRIVRTVLLFHKPALG